MTQQGGQQQAQEGILDMTVRDFLELVMDVADGVEELKQQQAGGQGAEQQRGAVPPPQPAHAPPPQPQPPTETKPTGRFRQQRGR